MSFDVLTDIVSYSELCDQLLYGGRIFGLEVVENDNIFTIIYSPNIVTRVIRDLPQFRCTRVQGQSFSCNY